MQGEPKDYLFMSFLCITVRGGRKVECRVLYPRRGEELYQDVFGLGKNSTGLFRKSELF